MRSARGQFGPATVNPENPPPIHPIYCEDPPARQPGQVYCEVDLRRKNLGMLGAGICTGQWWRHSTIAWKNGTSNEGEHG